MRTISILSCFLAVASVAFIGILDDQAAYAGLQFSVQVTKTTTAGDGVFTFDLNGNVPNNPLDTCSIDTSTQSSCNLSSIFAQFYTIVERPQSGWMQDSTTCPGTIDASQTPTVVCDFVNSPIRVGGEMIPVDSTSLLVAGAQSSAAWMIPVIVATIGIGIVIARKF